MLRIWYVFVAISSYKRLTFDPLTVVAPKKDEIYPILGLNNTEFKLGIAYAYTSSESSANSAHTLLVMIYFFKKKKESP